MYSGFLYIYVVCYHCTGTTDFDAYLHTRSLHDAIPICSVGIAKRRGETEAERIGQQTAVFGLGPRGVPAAIAREHRAPEFRARQLGRDDDGAGGDRKSTRLNSSHQCASRMPSSA